MYESNENAQPLWSLITNWCIPVPGPDSGLPQSSLQDKSSLARVRCASEMSEWGARVRFGRKGCLWKAPEAVMEGAEVQGRFLLKLHTTFHFPSLGDNIRSLSTEGIFQLQPANRSPDCKLCILTLALYHSLVSSTLYRIQSLPCWKGPPVPPHHPWDRSHGAHQQQEQGKHRLAVLPGQGEEGEEGDLHPVLSTSPAPTPSGWPEGAKTGPHAACWNRDTWIGLLCINQMILSYPCYMCEGGVQPCSLASRPHLFPGCHWTQDIPSLLEFYTNLYVVLICNKNVNIISLPAFC